MMDVDGEKKIGRHGKDLAVGDLEVEVDLVSGVRQDCRGSGCGSGAVLVAGCSHTWVGLESEQN